MDIKLALHRAAGAQDVVVSVDPSSAVGVLARRMLEADPNPDLLEPGPLTLAVLTPAGWHTVPGAMSVAESGIRSGSTATVVVQGSAAQADGDRPVLAVVTVLAGPDEGREFGLRAGEALIGRSPDADVVLDDPLVSKRHAVLRIGQDLRLIDHNSANGMQVGGLTVASVALTARTQVVLGDSVIQVRLLREDVTRSAGSGPVVVFNRSPRVEKPFVGLSEEIAEPPRRQAGQPFPFFSVIIMVGLGIVLWQFTKIGLTAVFLALGSMMLVGSVLEQARYRRRNFRREAQAYRAAMAEQRDRFLQARVDEQVARRAELPSGPDIRTAVLERTPALWARRPDADGFGLLRLGLTTRPSRSQLKAPSQRGDTALLAEANALAAEFTDVGDVPLAYALAAAGSLGICGPQPLRSDVARGAVLQLAGLHAPQDLTVWAVTAPDGVPHWSWLRWLPHCAAEETMGGVPLGADAESCHRVIAAVEQVVLDRTPQSGTQQSPQAQGLSQAPGARRPPMLLLVVDDATPVERGRLVRLAERGGRVGVHLLWTADSLADLPSACRTYLDLGLDGTAAVGDAVAGELAGQVRTEGVDAGTAESVARLMAPVVDGGAEVDQQADLPRSVSFVELAGRELVCRATAVVERWRETGSLGAAGVVGAARKPGSLRALVGQGTAAPFHLDLREHGPHALVGGTTGAGKSEFLQSWILGMALDHSPQRVTFLLVDYKGGAAFAEVVRLPHTVGLVTDLTPRLVRRALTSLRAEVRHRERILAAAGAPDLLELERRGDPSAPPALVIVVDEFAALVQEVPEFVDGMIDIAQRGRSLGLHLILATQRPAGVIKNNLRANTNLRVALRMADADDSTDVLGSHEAALFDPSVPGRAMAKTGPGRVTPFQAAYAGGRTSAVPLPPKITVRTLGFGPAQVWDTPDLAGAAVPGGGPGGGPSTSSGGPTDVTRLVETIGQGAREANIAAPRRPWVPELPAAVELTGLGRSSDAELIFGTGDDPERQQRTPATYRPDDDGTLLVIGAGGTGRSTALRGLAISAGLAEKPCHVYGLDFGSRGLSSLECLPHVGAVIAADDDERVMRLLDRLRGIVDERAERYAAASAATIEDYRVRATAPHEARILVLLDNFGAFRSAYELSRSASRLYEMLPALALDGRAVGVHLVISADRPGVVPSALAATVKKRLALKLVQDVDLISVGLRPDSFAADAPAGRGYLDGLEVQVAVLGDAPDVAAQVEAMTQLAARMRDTGAAAAPEIGSLPECVDLSQLAVITDRLPTFGIAGDTLAPIGFTVDGTFLIAGPPQSGRTTAMLTAVHALRRTEPERRLVYFGTGRSPLVAGGDIAWARTALTLEEAASVAAEWTLLAAGQGAPRLGAVIENLTSFSDTPAQAPLEKLIAAFGAAGHVVVADGEISSLTSAWGLPKAMKSGRHGLLLQPDQQDGDNVLRTAFPRMLRAEFPPGRGMYVRSGKARKVQVALPA